MTTALKLVVYGVPVGKGSARAFVPKGWKRPIITSTSRSAKSWEGLIAAAASQALTGSGQLFHGPIRLTVAFYLPRPKSLPRRVQVHTKKPDLDKLARCCLDSLTGVLWRDDSQVIELHATKTHTGVGDSPRAEITIEPLDAAERLFLESSLTSPAPPAERAAG